MRETLTLLVAGAAGGLLGAVFFSGLWWTVHKGLAARQPALWFFAGMVLRTGLVLGGFYAVSGSHWERLSACLLGFIAARLIVSRFTRLPEGDRTPPQEEPSHASQP